jgi:hypothetical protein
MTPELERYWAGTKGALSQATADTAAIIEAFTPWGIPSKRITASPVEHQFLVPVVYQPSGPALTE